MTIPKLTRSLLCLLLGFGISLLFLATRVHASSTVLMRYNDQSLTVPLTELQAFANNQETSTEIQEFLQKTNQNPADVQRWLTASVTPTELTRRITSEFVLLQINRVIGEPLRRENLAPLDAAFEQALNNGSLSILELIENYPKSQVRIEMSTLGQVYTDISSLVTRLEPVLRISQRVLPRLLCSCPADQQSSIPGQTAIAYQPAIGNTIGNKSLPSDETIPTNPALLARESSDSPAIANKDMVIRFGIFGTSIPLADMTRFVETGDLSPGWRSIFGLAGVNPDLVRVALGLQVPANVQFFDRSLNNIIGEFLLFQVGQVIHTSSRVANIPALRSSFVLSAADDGRISLLELFQRYPTPQLNVDARQLARFGQSLSQFQLSEAAQTTVASLGDWVGLLRASLEANVCNCENTASL